MILRMHRWLLVGLLSTSGCAGSSFEVAATGDGGTDTRPVDAVVDTGTSADGTSDTGTSPTDSGVVDGDAVDAGPACTKSSECATTSYCVLCGGAAKGVCKPKPAAPASFQPVCGCDGITYWNATVAQNKGVTPNGAGECKPGKMCGGIANIQCPAGTKCNFKQANKGSCAISDPAGVCWGLPTQCPQILIGPQTRECLSNKCTEACAIIKLGLTYYDDNTCPQ